MAVSGRALADTGGSCDVMHGRSQGCVIRDMAADKMSSLVNITAR